MLRKQRERASRESQPSIFVRLRLVLTFSLVVLMVLVGYYYLHIQRKSDYLMNRNFRLLTSMGERIESSMRGQRRILEHMSRKPEFMTAVKEEEKALEKQKALALERALLKEKAPKEEKALEDEKTLEEERQRHTQKKNEILRVLAPQFDSVRISKETNPGAGDSWHKMLPGPEGPVFKFFQRVTKDPEKPLLEGEVKLRRLVERSLASREAFESVLLARGDGQVVYQKGSPNLGITHLSALKAPKEDKGSRERPTPAASEPLFGASELREGVKVAGKHYRLFVEPFSLPIQTSAPRPGDRPAGGIHEETWLLCGLIPERKQAYDSMAVSSALLMLLLGGLLLALLSWPFVKLRLLGDRQRVRLLDVWLVVVCTLAGAAIATLTLLDLLSFQRFSRQAEAQAGSLAEEMERRLIAEISKAHEQLVLLEGHAGKLDLQLEENKEKASFVLADEVKEEEYKGEPYPLWDNFALIDKNGMQQVKWSTSTVVPARIDATARPYYQRVRDQDLWHLRSGDKDLSLFVQPIVSWTRGNKLAVLSKRADIPGYAVSILVLPMPSLIDPVLPPGFEFVVIASDSPEGEVLFHSDSERNQSEDFFSETDQDRRLRSAVFAKRSETMNLRYWGDDYIARVEPVNGLPWTIVTLRKKELIRAVNLEWIVTTASFILIYLGLLGALLVTVVAIRPSYRASWLWPDRNRDYAVLSLILLILAAAFGLAIFRLPGGPDLFAVSIFLPFVAIVTAYLRLGRPEHRTGRNTALLCGGLLLLVIAFPILGGSLVDDAWPGSRLLIFGLTAAAVALAAKLPRRDRNGAARPVSPARSRYAWAGVLLLLLTSVLPTLGFFASARRIQFESFVKHGQLRLALSLQERVRRVQRDARRERYPASADKEADDRLQQFVRSRLAFSAHPAQTLRGLDVYTTPFFGTQASLLERPASAELPKTGGTGLPKPEAAHGEKCPCEPEPSSRLLARIFEEGLPRASEPSVEMRELVHWASSDCAWHWLRGSSGKTLGLYSESYPGGGLALLSAPGKREIEAADLVAFLAWLLLGALLFWLVGFVSRHVFLLDPTDPAWPAKGMGPSRLGLHQFLVSRKGDWKLDLPPEALTVDLGDLRDGPAEEHRWRRLLRSAQGRDVLVRGFGESLLDEDFQGEVLGFLEDLVEKHQNRIIILSTTYPVRLLPSAGRNGRPSQMEERWRSLLSSFKFDDENLRSVVELELEGLHPVLREECGSNRDLLEIARDLNGRIDPSATREQVLEEFAELTERYYRSLWASCTRQEEVVLAHLAEDGFVSEGNRRAIRRLIARMLVQRAPHLRLMNETFRRFVLSSICKSQVRAVEQEAEPSAWDRLRVPFFIGLATSLLVLFTTQQALLDGAAGTVAGLAAGIPALMQMMDLLGGKFPGMR